MTRAERNENGIGLANARRRYLAEEGGNTAITPETHRYIDSLRPDRHGLTGRNPYPRGSRAASDSDQDEAAKELLCHAHWMWEATKYY